MTSFLSVTSPARLRRNPHALACGALALTLAVTAVVGPSTAAWAVVFCVALAVGYAGTTLIDGPVPEPTRRDRAVIRTALPAAAGLVIMGVALLFAGETSIGLLLGAAAATIVGLSSAIAEHPTAIVIATRTRPSTARAVTALVFIALGIALVAALTST